MQHEGKPQFIKAHTGTVRGIAFSPRDRYIFCSGGIDGKICIYNALQAQLLIYNRIQSPHAMRNVNAVKFNADGTRILSTTSKRLSVIDPETCDIIYSYNDCAYSGKDRAPLASDPQNPNIAVCACTNGKGLTIFDLRRNQPAHFSMDIHSTLITDVIYLDESWPFGANRNGSVVSLSSDGVCKIMTLDDRVLQEFDVKHRSNCLTATPDVYSVADEHGFESNLMIGGDLLSTYLPGNQNQPPRLFTYGYHEKTIQKLKYTSNEHLLYAITTKGQVRRYKRMGDKHHYLGEVYSHEDDCLDMDISPNDEYIATASQNGSVGLMCLGAPSHGWTDYMELA